MFFSHVSMEHQTIGSSYKLVVWGGGITPLLLGKVDTVPVKPVSVARIHDYRYGLLGRDFLCLLQNKSQAKELILITLE